MSKQFAALDQLDSLLSSVKTRRWSSPLANDIYEACTYWSHLGHRALNNDTRVDYAARASAEIPLLQKLQSAVRDQGDETTLSDALATGESVLRGLQQIRSPEDGHLAILRTIRTEFGFLTSKFNFQTVKEEPIGTTFSSGDVYVTLGWATTPYLSCQFGPEKPEKKTFWIDDLLYMMHDSRYRTIPGELTLDTEERVEKWFGFLATILEEQGRDVLTNQPGIFDKLEEAQAKRDQEYTRHMNSKLGSSL